MAHCKTDAEFRKKLYKAQGNAIIPLERYKSAHTKIEVKCKYCRFVWSARPCDLYNGTGCPRCSLHNRRKTDAEFRKKLYETQGNAIIPLEKYKNAYTKIKVKCRHCGLVWKICPHNLYRGSGCPRCAPALHNYCNHHKTNVEFRKGLHKVHGNAIIPLEKYKSCHTLIKVKCRHCGFVWKARPSNLYDGHGCPRCASVLHNYWNPRKTNAEFRKSLHKVHGNEIIPLERYKNAHTKIKIKCRHCGFVWKACPEYLLKGSGCPRCAVRNHRKTNAEFRKSLHKVHGNEIIPLEKYKTMNTKIKIRCRHCGLVWEACPDSLLRGSGCPRCDRHCSYGEKYIYHYLRHHLYAHFGYGQIIPANGLHFDFWIPSMRLAIEFDGAQHFRYVPYFCGGDPNQFKKSIHRDCCKNRYCLRHHITLIRIQNFHNDSNYKRIHHTTYHILSRVFSAYRHHRLHTHIYRFNVNNHGHLLRNNKASTIKTRK